MRVAAFHPSAAASPGGSGLSCWCFESLPDFVLYALERGDDLVGGTAQRVESVSVELMPGCVVPPGRCCTYPVERGPCADDLRTRSLKVHWLVDVMRTPAFHAHHDQLSELLFGSSAATGADPR